MAKRIQKLARLRQEKERLEQKIVELQAQIMVLDDEIQQQEDKEIIGAVRATSMSLEELKLLLELAAQNPDPQNEENEVLVTKPEVPAQAEQTREEEQKQ